MSILWIAISALLKNRAFNYAFKSYCGRHKLSELQSTRGGRFFLNDGRSSYRAAGLPMGLAIPRKGAVLGRLLGHVARLAAGQN